MVASLETKRAPIAIGPGQAAFALSLIGAALFYWSGLASLVDAWAMPEYSHGPIIPLVSGFLFLREMRHVPPTAAPVTDRWPGVALCLFALVIGLLGNLVAIPDIVTYGFILWVAGLILTLFGLRRGFLFWPAVVHLVFMLPLPQFVYWQVSVGLQLVSSEIGVWLIRMIGIPVYLDGNIIDLGVYKLQVAEACSGLRYLFPMLSFSYVFAVLYQGPVWHKLVLLASAAPITVAMNSFRIGMIGVLVDSYGIEQAEGFLHAFEGWIIFIACVAILFLLATILQRLRRDPRSLSETLDIEFEGLGDQMRRFGDITISRPLIFTAALTLAAALAWHAAPDRASAAAPREPLVVFPQRMEQWRGATQTLERSIERVLKADDYFSATYLHPEESAPVDFFTAYYASQTEGSGIHSPEVCIPTGGWEVSAWREIEVTLDSGEIVRANSAVIQKGTQRQLVYFWFEQRGVRLTSDYAAKALTVMDSLSRGRSDGGLVRLITPIDAGGREAAERRLERFMEVAVAELPRFFPE